ncbi:MAG: 2-dehydropantoate 2-reductase [Candidatus Andeanibacterium colombiense]|uniref:2-dehydropantoate 2-reductase n=1 Tax=Candidatus Andeanibacterium colombiense TaxID=3121345 RepID=A0AAJ5X508_9SPHN|nr:MAG: 2-dehydropantoate 2-reductase [Sphingomonadaceae bacterium]
MRVVILGAGAMGCLYGAAFHRAGCEVTLVDVNREHIAAINDTGLDLETRAGRELLPISASLPEDAEGLADLVLVFTKVFHTDTALAGAKHLIGPETYVLTLQNGLGNAERIAAHVEAERVLAGIASLPADLVGPGRVRSLGEGGSRLYPAFSGDAGFAGKVADLLTEGGLKAELDPKISEAIWEKAIFNAAMNPPCALTRKTPGFFLGKPEAEGMIHAVVEEGTAAANANGLAISSAPIHALTRVSMTDHADHEASMLQDVKAGRRTEIDAINGAIVEAAKRAGIAVPVTETLYRLVKLEEAKLTS